MLFESCDTPATYLPNLVLYRIEDTLRGEESEGGG